MRLIFLKATEAHLSGSYRTTTGRKIIYLKSTGDPGTHLINLRRMKVWVDIEATWCFWGCNIFLAKYLSNRLIHSDSCFWWNIFRLSNLVLLKNFFPIYMAIVLGQSSSLSVLTIYVFDEKCFVIATWCYWKSFFAIYMAIVLGQSSSLSVLTILEKMESDS